LLHRSRLKRRGTDLASFNLMSPQETAGKRQ
jgi:hypothetical protein